MCRRHLLQPDGGPGGGGPGGGGPGGGGPGDTFSGTLATVVVAADSTNRCGFVRIYQQYVQACVPRLDAT